MHVEGQGDPEAEYRERQACGHEPHQTSSHAALELIPRAGLHGYAAGGSERRYLIDSAILKIGRYMAIKIEPTEPPRKTIIRGSSMAVRPSTAASTSSS